MATPREYIENFLEGLELFGVRVRPMMGDYVVYCNDKTVGSICDGHLFVKITPASRKLLEGAPELPPYAGAKPSFLVESTDKQFLAELLQAVAAEIQPKKRNDQKSTA